MILEVRDLAVEYRTLEGIVYAVNGMDFELQKGHSLGIVGETGAGKTTMALSILRLLPRQGVITRGRILFEKEDLVKAKEKDLQKIRGDKISMVFQDPMSSLNPVFTVKQQIAEVVKIHRQVSNKEADDRAIEMLRAVGISEDRADNYPHEFSGGMIQRVMIAIALSCQPKLLILDEPTTALDVTIQAQVLDLVKRLRAEFSTSMILITHDLGIVPEICDEVAVVYSGRVVEKGGIGDVYKDPRHPYTEGLFNCVPDIEDPDKKLIPISGLSPSSRLIPPGCPFHPRCKDRFDPCDKSAPRFAEVSPGHYAACYKYRECC